MVSDPQHLLYNIQAFSVLFLHFFDSFGNFLDYFLKLFKTLSGLLWTLSGLFLDFSKFLWTFFNNFPQKTLQKLNKTLVVILREAGWYYLA